MLSLEKKNEYLSLKQFCAKYEWPSYHKLRYLIYQSKETWWHDAIIRIGKEIVIKPKRFFELIEKHDRFKRQKDAAKENSGEPG